MRANAMLAAGILTLLAGCDEPKDPAKEAADVAEIEAMHDMPTVQPISPERISYNEIEKNNLFGAGCGFAPENGIAIVFLAQENHGFIKLDGKIRDLAPDKGSPKLPLSAYGKYNGREYVVELSIDEVESANEGIEKTNYAGNMIVRDVKGRIVFDKPGTVGCGS